MKLTEVATERFVDNITSITPGALKGGLMTVDRHPTKDELLCGGADGTPKIYQMYRTKDRKIGDDFNLLRAFDPLPGRIFDACFNADGSRILVGSSLAGRAKCASTRPLTASNCCASATWDRSMPWRIAKTERPSPSADSRDGATARCRKRQAIEGVCAGATGAERCGALS